ncbi:MAG: GDP-mannose 4,6-dehydratase [Candidatus Humimicrobiaceae bacterium]|nr:GDP-mannose 4,6-dehydratase [Actinomycetota bacterium]MDD5600523.1 GDP-mannose 4,6-dehydratase [Actinomycetota bacterium]MDY0027480.1 GDP-mannose 4,6-dehydratase [Candidatus Humimicrobiaceae bacterium]
MKILITGIGGFVGKHLTSYLVSEQNKEKNQKILGIDINLENFNLGGYSLYNQNIELEEIDLTDREKVFDVIKRFKPDHLYHLAAQSSVSYSWENPIETFRVNVFGGVNILEGVRAFCPECRVLMVCTAEEYGEVDNEDEPGPIDENFKIYPQNPYAISKSAADFFSSVYSVAYGLPIFISRSFNHIGPGQSERFVASDFAKQIALIDKGMQEPVIMVGNLECYRDFLDVRDAVKAYFYIINRGNKGQAYNVCSGEKTKISDLLNILISLSETQNIRIETDSAKLRAIDVKVIYGDNSKLRTHTGWSPEYSLKKSLEDTLGYWKKKII